MAKQIGKYDADFQITMAGWNEPIYIEYEGALRAMMFEKLEVTLKNVESFRDKGINFVYHAKIAGVGRVQFDSNDWKTFRKDFWLTPNDFGNREECCKAHKILGEFPFMTWLADCFGMTEDEVGKRAVKSLYQCDVVSLYRYVWDGVKANAVACEIPNKVYFEIKRGWYFAEPCNFPTDSFASKEECENANRVRVVEFTDDDAAGDDAEVEKVLRKQIRNEVMQSFCTLMCASDIESMNMAMVDAVVQDVKECSDYPHYNDSDVRIAIQRVILNRVIGE